MISGARKITFCCYFCTAFRSTNKTMPWFWIRSPLWVVIDGHDVYSPLLIGQMTMLAIQHRGEPLFEFVKLEEEGSREEAPRNQQRSPASTTTTKLTPSTRAEHEYTEWTNRLSKIFSHDDSKIYNISTWISTRRKQWHELQWFHLCIHINLPTILHHLADRIQILLLIG